MEIDWAAKKGYLDGVKILYSEDIMNKYPEIYDRALYYSFNKGKEEIFKFLYSKRKELNPSWSWSKGQIFIRTNRQAGIIDYLKKYENIEIRETTKSEKFYETYLNTNKNEVYSRSKYLLLFFLSNKPESLYFQLLIKLYELTDPIYGDYNGCDFYKTLSWIYTTLTGEEVIFEFNDVSKVVDTLSIDHSNIPDIVIERLKYLLKKYYDITI